MRLFFLLLLFLCAVSNLTAQRRFGETTIYPTQLYPGENVITISNEHGIDKIRPRASSNTTVILPTITGCPKQVDVRVVVANSTTGESVDFTVYDCNGLFGTQSIPSENWTIRRESTGKVEVGRDTCVPCEISTTDVKTVDSIVVNNPNFTVRMPGGGPPWRAVGNEFKYYVCYKPAKVETINETIRLHIRRAQPNGGLTHYVIEKPITATAVPPPPPPPAVVTPADTLPPLEDPTTFRNIVMPTAESVGAGRFFVGNYDLAGWIAGYGVTDRLTGLFGAVAVPDVISELLVATVGAKYEVIQEEQMRLAVGFQYAYTSTKESNITLSAPFAIFSLGDRKRRISLAAGYSWKTHTAGTQTFDRNAYLLALGGDYTVARNWKIAAETYVIESSGLAPVAVTARWFNERFAFDGGIGIDLAGGTDVRGTSSLSGEIRSLSIAPIISFIWKW